MIKWLPKVYMNMWVTKWTFKHKCRNIVGCVDKAG